MKKQTIKQIFRFNQLLVFLLFASCATKPLQQTTEERELHRSQWSARAEVKDKKTTQISTVDMDAFVDGSQRLRIEVSGSFAVSLATAVLNRPDNQLTYLLHQQKKAYRGRATAKAVENILLVPLPASLVFHIFNDEAIDSPGWRCEMDVTEKPSFCENKTEKISISWSQRLGPRKKVVVQTENFELQMGLTQVPTKVQNWDKVFDVSIPDSYRQTSK